MIRVLHAGNKIEDTTSNEIEIPEAADVEEEKDQTRVSYNIVFVTAEASPYSKTGGLGDVCGSLPIALAGRGHRVMVVSPKYTHGTSADDKFSGTVDLDNCVKVYCFGGVQEVGFFHEYREGVDWVGTSDNFFTHLLHLGCSKPFNFLHHIIYFVSVLMILSNILFFRYL